MLDVIARRKMLLAAISLGAAAFSGVLPATATAQDSWPSRPVRLIVPFPPGGSADIHARPLAEELRRRLGQAVVVDNRAGAAGAIAGTILSRASADGYTLLLDPGSVISMVPLVQDTPWTADDFTPVAKLSQGPFAVVVHPDVPARNLDELLRLAREQPGGLNYGSAGPGSATHLVSEALWLRTQGADESCALQGRRAAGCRLGWRARQGGDPDAALGDWHDPGQTAAPAGLHL
jgi:tripartite-type tricarboxylate transporter receptor subunit TctC